MPNRDLTVNEAFALTKRIRTAVDKVWSLLLEAHDRKAWRALKYPSWEAYIKAEFQIGRAHAYRLLDQGRVIRAIEEATGNLSPSGDISEAAARDIKDDLPSVTEEIKARVEQGEVPQKAATDVIAAKRAQKDRTKADKKAQQAEHDRQRNEARAKLPDAVKQSEVVREAAIAAAKASKPDCGLTDAERVAELEEHARIVEAENAELKVENAKFGDMWVQYQKGGFDAVIAGKDEEIRSLNARLIQESEDKAGWMNRARAWQKRALDLGWSSDVVIPIDQQSDEVIRL
ncbi:MAG: hypothetical protein EOS54_04370 [Mesorhizobium sp.]|uniref:hypothetical protein n=1 Tax=Mesorhizobium sp. TaxID=1871066 RepID=UPI000FE8A75B|nr:hypothetical protein [Mesorhizobium sp.]RWC57741.1 MAG: hypothetical protein EOS54_04370 [Mesorhizobium sp.]TIV82184.1 MAG: hypothetical protein E5V64_13015 [Mesorhizobium sp.]TIW14240.1 MAG: hypothetical protein E5V66_00285 [Mesorhizobium sp.]TIW48323.1 MAG: hypothetical protein E5V61_05220 [Mesorhizobium sp.]TIX11096.1 MAG: hypothetical protein E5V46_18030 [Mesorhizobium sp.]